MNKPPSTLPSTLVRRLVKGVALLAVLSTLSACIVVPSRGWGRGHGHHGQATPQAVPQVAAAPPMYFVPGRGQPQAVQERERYECYQWAVRETKFDPGMTPTVVAAAPARVGSHGSHGGEVVAGAATGAVMGAVVGGPRRAPEAMVIGAIFGAMVGAAAQDSRARDEARSDARYAATVQQAGVPMNNFRRAMSACMEGRGYRVTA